MLVSLFNLTFKSNKTMTAMESIDHCEEEKKLQK